MSVFVGQIRTCRVPHAPWHPGATHWRHLTAERDPRPQLLEEAAAVGPQVIGYEFAWKLRLRRSVQNSLPTSVWKLWISSLVEPQAHAWLSSGAFWRLYDTLDAGLGSLERGTCSGFLGKSANFCGLAQTSDISPPFVGRRRACQALN